jgi:capsular exopolysaccharide synthesis family protein
MSQIFDALLRSEGERNGQEAAAAAHATEFLQRTENFVAAKGESAETCSPSRVAIVEEPVAEAERPNGLAAAVAGAIPIAIPTPLKTERAEGPLQCEVLRVVLPTESRLVSLPDKTSPASEAFHLLGVRLRHMRRQRPLKKVLITSTIPQEGKSMVAANLACALALKARQKVVLVEGDLRRPSQSKIFGIPDKPGISEWLNEARSLDRSMYRLEGPGIWILPAGVAIGNSSDLLQSSRVAVMMDQLAAWFDWVVIDSPPILPLADTSVWTNMADGILLVTRQGITQKRQLQRGLEALGTQKLIGALLNSARSVAHSDYYYLPNNQLPSEDAKE